MSKKTLITCVALLCILLGGIAAAVAFLYAPGSKSSVPQADRSILEARYPLLGAVPSDAAMLLRFSDLEDGLRRLTDSTRVFGHLAAGSGNRGFDRFVSRLAELRKEGRLRSLAKAGCFVSVHYSGDLVPLMGVAAPKDTTPDLRLLMAAADSLKMSYELSGTVLLVSPARTLVSTAVRHLDGGVSVFDSEGFPEIVSATGGSDAVYVSHRYANKLFGAWLNRPYAAHAGFFSTLTGWSGFSWEDAPSGKLRMHVATPHGENGSGFLHTLAPAELRAASVLPASTYFMVDLPVDDLGRWTEAWRKYLDAAKKLGRYKSGDAAFQKANGLSAEQWARRLDIKEVAKAAVMTTDGASAPLLLIRPGKADAAVILKDTGLSSFREYRPAVLPFAWKGYTSLLFGSLFSLPDETMFTWLDGWMIVGGGEAVSAFVGEDREESLRDFLASGGTDVRLPEKGASLLAYVSMNAPLADEVFRPAMAAAWKKTLEGIALEPVVLTMGTGTSGSLSVDRVAVRPRRNRAGEVSAAEASPEVPRGPFKVRNSGTGKENLLSQADNMALQLRDENGKTLWSIPFKTPLCGRVEEVDYYANGKIQFLFASGSKLYLLDRLGRMVGGFPAETGKEIVLGPAVYDFTGAHGYTAMVLHKDNTIGMYDLHGRVRDGWLGISCETAITALPELVTSGGIRYWVVRTAAGQPAVFGFLGGEPVAKGEARKVLKGLK